MWRDLLLLPVGYLVQPCKLSRKTVQVGSSLLVSSQCCPLDGEREASREGRYVTDGG